MIGDREVILRGLATEGYDAISSLDKHGEMIRLILVEVSLLAERYGHGDAARTIQDLFLAGKKTEAIAAVPDALVDEVALVGDRARIADRLAAFRDCGVETLILQARQPEALRLVAELV